MTSEWMRSLGILVVLTVLGCAGCGGGGAAGETAVPGPGGTVSLLAWDPPVVAADGTPMDPRRDLDYYEFYLRTDQNFGDTDLPVAQVASFTDVLSPSGKSFTRKLTTEFLLENLLPFTEKGKHYYISIRAVGVDGLKSEFMVPVAWDLS